MKLLWVKWIFIMSEINKYVCACKKAPSKFAHDLSLVLTFRFSFTKMTVSLSWALNKWQVLCLWLIRTYCRSESGNYKLGRNRNEIVLLEFIFLGFDHLCKVFLMSVLHVLFFLEYSIQNCIITIIKLQLCPHAYPSVTPLPQYGG